MLSSPINYVAAYRFGSDEGLDNICEATRYKAFGSFSREPEKVVEEAFSFRPPFFRLVLVDVQSTGEAIWRNGRFLE